MNVKHTKRKSIGKKQVLTYGATIAIAVFAMLVFLYRDSLSELFSGGFENSENIESEAYTFETGSRQFFSMVGDKLAIASSTGLQILNSKGETLERQVYSMVNPAISRSADSCVIYDVGGQTLRYLKNGEYRELDRDYPITSAQLNSSNYLAVAEQEVGYKGAVAVLSPEGAAVYEWFSGSGYVVDAAVSPDCSCLAVLCIESSGSIVHVFKLNSETEYYSVSLPGELAFRLNFFKNGDFCTISEYALRFFSGDRGKPLGEYQFEDKYLAGFELSDELCAVVLSKYVSGSEVTLLSLSSDGDVYGSTSLSGEPVSMFAQKQQLLVLCSDRVTVFARDLRTLQQGRVVAGYMGAVLTPKNDVVLLTSHYVEKYHMK